MIAPLAQAARGLRAAARSVRRRCPRRSATSPAGAAIAGRPRRDCRAARAATALNTSSNRRSACVSVNTAKAGSTRASTGRSRSRSAQNVWMVLMCASSKSCTAASSRPLAVGVGAGLRPRALELFAKAQLQLAGRLFAERDRDDLADRGALLLRSARRCVPTSSVVLPVPAAASTISVLSSSRVISSRFSGDSARRSRAHGIFLSASRSANSLRVLAPGAALFLAAADDLEVAPVARLRRGPRRQRAVLDRAIDDLEHLETALRRLAHQRNLVRMEAARARADRTGGRRRRSPRGRAPSAPVRRRPAAARGRRRPRSGLPACGSCRSCDR